MNLVLRAPQPQAIDVEERLWADCDLTAFILPWDGSAHSTSLFGADFR